MNHKLALIVCSLLLFACEAELNDQERDLAADIGLDEGLALRIRSHADSYEQFYGLSENYEATKIDGLLVHSSANDVFSSLNEIRNELNGSAYIAYLYQRGFGFGTDDIAVVPVENDYEYLEIVRISGINYDISHDDVVARYREWDSKYGLALLGANFEWLEAEINSPPEDWLRFAEEVYEFCPDVVDQGVGTVEALADELQRSGHLYLWWD